MSILGKYTENSNNTTEYQKPSKNLDYRMPAVTREDTDSISLKKGITISAIIHPVTIFIFWVVLAILAIFGIHLALFEKPKPKVNDIEFVLVDKEQTPKNKNTKFRADRNSRTGGINDPKKPISMPSSKPAAKPSKPASSSPAPAQTPKKQSILDKITHSVAPSTTKKSPSKATTTQKHVTPSPTVQQAVPKPQAAKPQPPTARPSVRPPMTPKAVQRPSNSPFKVPVPAGGTKAGQYATGPISGSGYGHGSGSGGGNPGGGGGRPGIDAIREPDFGPYMRELQRRIKMNWDPPKGNESKRVVLLFKIAKDGRLLSCSVFKSSGLQNADNAALNAVKLAAPFRPLPPEYKKSSIDVQFTFDYNVFGATKY